MRRMAMIGTVGLLALLVLGGCAGKKGYASVDEVFAAYDTNRDGRITKEEFTATFHDKEQADQAWKRIDSKGNGFVDRELAGDMPLDVWRGVETDTFH